MNLTAPADMQTQTDPPNARDLATTPGTEADYYFGCWLDINQPNQKFLPSTPPAGNFDGPWHGITLHSIQEAIVVAPHQCLIAEIRFDDTPIPNGATSASSDKLAQRNIAWIDGPNPGAEPSRRMVHPVQVRPTPLLTPNPDELMILWGKTPAASEAQLYLPALDAAAILRIAEERYAVQQLRLVDAHTIACDTRGVTFVPLPQGTALAAGLLSIDLPPGIRKGDAYTIMVRQLTDASAAISPPPPPPPVIEIARAGASAPAASIPPKQVKWRRVAGAFQFAIAISTKEQLLLPEERLLAVLRWIAQGMPKQKRWYPVLLRYIDDIAGRVQGFGGDPGKIEPSPTGQVPGLHRPRPAPGGHHHHEEGGEVTGKIDGLIYDHFGDFEGFILETEEGRHHRFASRELPMLMLVQRAWLERLRVTVFAKRHAPHVPRTIILRAGGR